MDNALLANPTIAEVCLKDLLAAIEKAVNAEKAVDAGLGDWHSLENETIISLLPSSNLSTVQLHRLYAKIAVLKRAFSSEGLKTEESPLHELLEDPIACPYLVELVNNNDGIFSDPEFLPHVTTMEIAWLVYELSHLLGINEADWMSCPRGFKQFCGYYLSEEGLTKPVAPFTFLRPEDLQRFRYEQSAAVEDANIHNDRQRAVDIYLQLMTKALCNVQY